MSKHLKPVLVIIIVSMLVGIMAGTVQKINLEAHKPVPEITYEDIVQKLNKTVETLEFKEKTSFVNGDSAITNKTINQNSDEEIIALFLVDISGSMITRFENKLVNVQEALVEFLPDVGPNTYLGMISYSSEVTVNVPLKKFDEVQARIMVGETQSLKAAGGTYMYEALALGLKRVTDLMYDHPNARPMIFVISDGVPSDEAKKFDFIEEYVSKLKIPVHTIGYGKDADKIELKKLAAINEATFTYVEDGEDVVGTLKVLFNSKF